MNGRRGPKGTYSSVPRRRLLRDKVGDKRGILIPSCLIGAFDGHHGNSSSLLLDYSPLPSPLSLPARVHPLWATRSPRVSSFSLANRALRMYTRLRLTKSVHTSVSRHAINIDGCSGRRMFLAFRRKLFHRCGNKGNSSKRSFKESVQIHISNWFTLSSNFSARTVIFETLICFC